MVLSESCDCIVSMPARFLENRQCTLVFLHVLTQGTHLEQLQFPLEASFAQLHLGNQVTIHNLFLLLVIVAASVVGMACMASWLAQRAQLSWLV